MQVVNKKGRSQVSRGISPILGEDLNVVKVTWDDGGIHCDWASEPDDGYYYVIKAEAFNVFTAEVQRVIEEAANADHQ